MKSSIVILFLISLTFVSSIKLRSKSDSTVYTDSLADCESFADLFDNTCDDGVYPDSLSDVPYDDVKCSIYGSDECNFDSSTETETKTIGKKTITTTKTYCTHSR
jgi:hypothetical protein